MREKREGGFTAQATQASGAFSKNADYRRALKPIDPFQIENKSPDRHYRFISRKLLDQYGGYDPRGFTPITKANSKGERLMGRYGTVSSGTDLVNGDLVVGFMPKEAWDVREQEKLMAQNRIDESITYFKQKAARLGMQPEVEMDLQSPGRSE